MRCRIEGCEEHVGHKSRSGICSQCTSSLYYWSKRSAARVLKRRSQLGKYTSRLGEFFDDDGKKAKPKLANARKGGPGNARVN